MADDRLEIIEQILELNKVREADIDVLTRDELWDLPITKLRSLLDYTKQLRGWRNLENYQALVQRRREEE